MVVLRIRTFYRETRYLLAYDFDHDIEEVCMHKMYEQDV